MFTEVPQVATTCSFEKKINSSLLQVSHLLKSWHRGLHCRLRLVVGKNECMPPTPYRDQVIHYWGSCGRNGVCVCACVWNWRCITHCCGALAIPQTSVVLPQSLGGLLEHWSDTWHRFQLCDQKWCNTVAHYHMTHRSGPKTLLQTPPPT